MNSNTREPFILFELAGATYAVRSRDIQQLDMVGNVTPVPNAPSFVDGVVSVRGQVIPAVNLRARFGFDRVGTDLRSRLLIIHAEHRSVALIVDSAREFALVDADTIQPPPAGVAGLSGEYLEGIVHLGERLVLILDVRQIINVPTEAPASAAVAEA